MAEPLAFWLMLVGIVATLWLYCRDWEPPAPATTYGSAGSASDADLKPLLATKLTKPGSLLLGYDRRGRELVLPPRLVRNHTLLLGVTGAGKTRVIIPQLLRTRPFVATDPKGELWKFTSGYQADPWRLAPRSPESSNRSLNWIPLRRDEHMAQLLAAALMQPEEESRELPFWKLGHQQTCAAAMAHVAHSDVPTPASLYELLTLAPRTFIACLQSLPVERARMCGQTLAGLRSEAATGIVMSVGQKLAFLHDPAVRRFTSADLAPPDFRRLADPNGPSAVYWEVHEEDVDLLKPLSSLFFTLLLHRSAKGASRCRRRWCCSWMSSPGSAGA